MAKPVFFSTPAKLNQWFEKHHESKDELLVGFYKKGTGKPSITWPESVDEALCFGWIDGIRRRIDDDSYSIRFTPRRKNSNWSARNIKRYAILCKEKRIQPAGKREYEKRKPADSGTYAYEQTDPQLESKYEKQFKSNQLAWKHFQALAPSIRRPSIWWVVSAKKEETRQRRLAKLIKCSEAGEILPQFLRKKSSTKSAKKKNRK